MNAKLMFELASDEVDEGPSGCLSFPLQEKVMKRVEQQINKNGLCMLIDPTGEYFKFANSPRIHTQFDSVRCQKRSNSQSSP